MSIKSKVLAATAALTMVGGVGTAGMLTAGTASAATPSCGFGCVNLYSHQFGKAFILDVYKRIDAVGAPVILFQKSNEDPAEDFDFSLEGTVSDFLAAGLVSPALALHYGKDYAFEIQYAPYGADTGLCVGLAATATQFAKVTLQGCGVSSKTIWVTDFNDPNYIFNHSLALINGSDTNFSHPFVLTYPQEGNPVDKPRPQLDVENLTGFAGSIATGPALDRQAWSAFFGPVK
jgi:hypothetical protein